MCKFSCCSKWTTTPMFSILKQYSLYCSWFCGLGMWTSFRGMAHAFSVLCQLVHLGRDGGSKMSSLTDLSLSDWIQLFILHIVSLSLWDFFGWWLGSRKLKVKIMRSLRPGLQSPRVSLPPHSVVKAMPKASSCSSIRKTVYLLIGETARSHVKVVMDAWRHDPLRADFNSQPHMGRAICSLKTLEYKTMDTWKLYSLTNTCIW